MEYFPGAVVWADFGEGRGPERAGIRPAVVVSSVRFLTSVDSLVHLIPATTRDRGWPNHVALRGQTGLAEQTWGMTEQLRSTSRQRVLRQTGSVDDATLFALRLFISEGLDL
ncbi:MAG: type II toxin-antitoxin system PemK/MazF family toxin [Pseudolysinimonas sp.]|uniref:type II toxin-antitoxin system PemK/MazF family toxin n=1 Tax=Pseudolysinimonas sp. TaxID=2680009 RepID=UPI0032673980